MALPVPIVGVDPGPDYATNVNTCFFFIDSHDHSSGKGIPITQAGINITSALPFSSNPATGLSYLNFTSQVAVSAQKSLYVLNNDLYFRDGNNGQIALTAGGSIAGTLGSIGGLSGGASCTYNSANQTFVFAQSPTTAANLDAANVILRNTTSPYNYVTLKAPTALATTYDFVYPSALPATQKFMTLDGSGNAAAPWAVDGSTIEVASGTTVQVKNLGVTLAKLATEVIQHLVPTGTVLPFGGSVAPSGYLICDGSQVNRTGTYAALFDVLSPAQTCNTTNASAAVTVTSSADMQVGMAVFGAGIPNNTVISSISNATTIVISQNATATQTGVSLRFGGFGQGNLSTTFNLPDFRGRFLRGVDGTAGRDPDKTSRTAMNSGGNTGNSVGSTQAQEIQSHSHGFTYNYDAGSSTDSATRSNAYFGTNRSRSTDSAGGNETRPINAYVNYIIKF